MLESALVYNNKKENTYYFKNLDNEAIICLDDPKFIELYQNGKCSELRNNFLACGFICDEIKSTPLIVILTTYNCNFNCPYCYEHEKKDVSYTDNDIDMIMNYIEKNYLGVYPKIEINFSGGEPLIAFSNLKKFVTCLNNIFDGLSTQVEYSLTTNGSLLSNDILNFLNKNKFSIQISLDGNRYLHNKTRSFKNNTPSYDVISESIKNIVLNYPRIKLTLRYNIVGIDNVYLSMIDELNSIIDIEYRNKIFIYFSLIDTKEFIATSDSLEMIEFIQLLYKQAFDNNYNIPTSYTSGGDCMIKDNCSICITPGNKVFKCYSLVSYDELSDNMQGYENKPIIHKDKLCYESCAFKPVCYGGCLYRSYIKDKVFSRNCRKKLLLELNAFLFFLQLHKLGVTIEKDFDVKNITTTFI